MITVTYEENEAEKEGGGGGQDIVAKSRGWEEEE